MVRHPWQGILALIGVALGVGVVTAVDLANRSAERAFTIAAETVSGRTTHEIVGAPAGLPETLYRDLKVRWGIEPIAPVVEGVITVAGLEGPTTLRLIGIDPFAERGFRNFGERFFRNTDLPSFIVRPATGMLLQSTAARLGVVRGGSLPIQANGVRRTIQLCGYLAPEDEVARQGLDSVLVVDIATAQEILGRLGRLSRIDMIVPEGAAGQQLLQRVASHLPPEASVIPASFKAGSLRQLTRAFRLNLTALSLLALIVGMFLIYNTVTFSVVRRRRLIGLLRSIGVTRRQVFALLCGESLLLGVAGSAAGLLFGALLGGQLTRLVTRTINDLYFVVNLGEATLVPAAFLKGALLGVGATLLATIPPALEATAAPPRAVISRAAIEARAARLLPWSVAAGVAVIVAGGAVLVGSSGIAGGFVGLFLLIAGYALLVPAGVVLLSRLARPVMTASFGAIGRLAARGVATALSRTGVATAALVVAVSATIGIGIMVGSFRQTVASWLESWLRADIYVTTVGTGSGRNKPPLDPDLVRRIPAVPGVAEVSMTRRVTLEGGEAPTELLAIDVPRQTFSGYRFREGRPAAAWPRFSAGEAVIVSEPYASRHGVHAGGNVVLRTARGVRTFPVAGVYYDYGSDSGVVAISRAAYARLWGDTTIDGIGVYAAAGVSVSELVGRLRAAAGAGGVTVISNRGLREASLAVFDRTFAITDVLRLLTVVVAFVGIISALMAIQLERARELAVLRAVGMTPLQAVGLVSAETGLMGITAGLLSLPLGIMQALVLVHVINRRSFGWTMELSVGTSLLVEALMLALIASLLGGLYPAWKMATGRPAGALQEDT